MSGFTDEDVTQAGSAGATTAVVTEIAPKDGTPKDGTMYDVAVSDMTKDGTVIASIPANKATDAAGNDNTVTFIANTPPTANADSYSVNEDGTLNVAAPGVLGNDKDPATGDTLTAGLESGPSIAASFKLNSDGSFKYTPKANVNGSDSFSYRARDNHGAESGAVTVSIDVKAVNDAPSFTSGRNVSVPEDSGAYSAAWATGISKGATNESSQTLEFKVTGNTNPTLFSAGPQIAPDGKLGFTPAPNASGSASITVVLKDDDGTTSGGADTSAEQPSPSP
jgi:hypothetical protein